MISVILILLWLAMLVLLAGHALRVSRLERNLERHQHASRVAVRALDNCGRATDAGLAKAEARIEKLEDARADELARRYTESGEVT